MLYKIKKWTDDSTILEVEAENLRYANFIGANLSYANLRCANLNGANFTGANLSYANLRCANLNGANFTGADLRSANFKGADLIGANLSYANLRCANLNGVNFTGADLRCANLSYANLIDANLIGASLPAVTTVLLAYWGCLKADTCLRAMRYDASHHDNPKEFEDWSKGGDCPYSGKKYQRVCNFKEKKELYKPGTPPNGYDLMMEILKQKCKI